MISLLVILLAIPLIGAIVGALLPDQKWAKGWALIVSLAALVVGVMLACHFHFSQEAANPAAAMQIAFPALDSQAPNPWAIDSIGFTFSLGMDSVSLWLVLLTVLLMPLAVLASFESIKDRPKEYYAWMLALLFAMLGVFIARDLLLFYVFFELTLVPMFFIIGIWGGPDRRRAAAKFFLFTFSGSVFTLASVIYLGMHYGTFDIALLVSGVQHGLTTGSGFVPALGHTERFWVVLGLLAGLAVKVPIFPVHTWLPLAHTEAPTAGSVILAGVLLKLGTYGIFRLALPLGLASSTVGGETPFPHLVHFLGVLAVIGIIYGALVAWVQKDIKKLVAYSSVSHLGFAVLGLVALNEVGIQGSILYMINHGLSTGALFLVIGMIYDRYHTRDINELSGLAKRMPILGFFFVLFAMSSIGLPGLNGFTSEFLTILGAFTSKTLGIKYGVFAALGVILGAVYMLHMTAKVIFGPLKTPSLAGHGDAAGHGHGGHDEKTPGDIGFREIAILVPIALAVIALGVMPNAVLKPIEGPSAFVCNPSQKIDSHQRTGMAQAPAPIETSSQAAK
jgi:NADH-quinone oxidoreductase subunit M